MILHAGTSWHFGTKEEFNSCQSSSTKRHKKGGEYPFLLKVSDDFEALLSANSESEENGESKASTAGAAVDSEAHRGECQQTQVDMDCNDSLTKTSGRSELVQQEVHVSSV